MSGSVVVRDVSKRYRRSGAGGRRSLFGPRRAPPGAVRALSDVSFEVEPGSALGIVGANGAGKSTLLRLVGGVARPDSGEIAVDGRIGAIFELGTGFHPDLTGRESAILSGLISGLTRRQVIERLPELTAFAELEDFIDEPLRMYSTGMTARLAFAIATSIDPDVLLVDEFVSVGDLAFRRRSFDRMVELRRSGVTMLVVSHDPGVVRDLCDEVIWLRAGRVVAAGAPDDVAERYEIAMAEHVESLTPSEAPQAYTPDGTPLVVRENRFGSLGARITSVRILGPGRQRLRTLRSGAGLVVEVEVDAPESYGDLNVGLKLLRADGTLCLDSSAAVRAPAAGSVARLSIERLDLPPGEYAFDVGLFSSDWEHPHDVHWQAYPLTVEGAPRAGTVAPPLSWDVERPPG